MDYIVKAENLSFSYPAEQEGVETKDDVLCKLNLEIERGSFTSVIGHNGSGKSTLAKLFCGVLTPVDGNVYVMGREHTEPLSVREEGNLFDIRKTVGIVFQNPDNQLVATVVEEDVAFAPENLGIESNEIRKRVDDALSLVGLTEYAKQDTHKLSGGQKQRVAIAGILAMMPECIIFDESTSMLDPKGREDVIRIIKELKDTLNITVILITHYMEEAALADRIVVMNDGHIVMDGDPESIFSERDKLIELGLDLPQSSEIIHRLKSCGCDIAETPLSTADASELIYNLFKE